MAISGVDSNTATIALGYADAIAEIYSQEWMIRRIGRQGPTKVQVPLDVRGRVQFNEDLESKNYIVPGLIAVIMMVIAAMLTSLCFAREWERGTMEQLISTPVRGSELVLGKLIPYFAIGLLDMVLAVVLGQFMFQVPLRGNVALLFGVASIFLVGVLTMGMLFSIATKSQLLASQLAMTTTFLPAFLFPASFSPSSTCPGRSSGSPISCRHAISSASSREFISRAWAWKSWPRTRSC